MRIILDGTKDFWLAQCRWLSTLAGEFPSSRRLAIDEALRLGATRAEVAEALGVTKQALSQALKAAHS